MVIKYDEKFLIARINFGRNIYRHRRRCNFDRKFSREILFLAFFCFRLLAKFQGRL